MVNYEMYKQNATDKCADCGKLNSKVSSQEWVIDYRHSPNYKPGDTAREYLCLNCGDRIHRINIEEQEEELRKIWEQKALVIRKKADELPTELRQLWDDLEPKVKNKDLEVKDVERIYALEKKTKEFLTESKNVNIDSEHWTKIKITSELLQNSSAELDGFIKKNASPRTRDIANKKKYQRIGKCFHENIERCTDDQTFFCCSYCWDTDSSEFLPILRGWHIASIDKTLRNNNISTIEFANNSNYDKLSNNSFVNQEELKSVYQEAKKDLKIFLKKKGIDINQQRERERESKFIAILSQKQYQIY